MTQEFNQRLIQLQAEQAQLINRQNQVEETGNGIFCRFKYPVLTAAHTPLEWRYDLDAKTNPHLMERFGINAVFNAGAIKFNGKYLMVAFIVNDSFMVNNRVLHSFAQAKTYSTAGPCTDKTILRTGIQGILTINKLGV